MEIVSTMVNTKVSVANASTEVLAEEPSREFATFVNDSDEVIYLILGSTAVINTGIRLNAAGGSFELNTTNMYKGAISAICTSGSKSLCVCWGA